eukprot:TRINITY_DN2199_c0_g1_i1.p1 TRINITY_DN2199_c0_g1~~TRINITY_DN2199_c0_g1_i1.p1  ORF type:complete len:345 (-),score=94.28 TRINITY_DN2199_c0_g1_i1:462-1496(-)
MACPMGYGAGPNPHHTEADAQGGAFPEPPIFDEAGGHRQHFLDNAGKLHELHLSWALNYGRIVQFRIGRTKMLQIADPVEAQKLLNANLPKSKFYNRMVYWLGKGVFSASIEDATNTDWKTQRKLVTPAFWLRVQSRMFHHVLAEGERMVADLRHEMNNAPGSVVEVMRIIQNALFRSIGSSALGNVFSDDNVDEMREAIYLLFSQANAPGDITERAKTDKKIREALDLVDRFTNDVIVRRRQELKDAMFKKEEESSTDQDKDKDKDKDKDNLLSVLLLSDASLSDTQIRDEIVFFMFAGWDTTSNSLGFLLLACVHYKKECERVRQEILSLPLSLSLTPLSIL